MALIAMAVYCTEENKKDECFEQALSSLLYTVDFKKHRLFLSVNGATERTKKNINTFKCSLNNVIFNDTNLGTAEAINLAWRNRKPGENAVKLDDDIIFHTRDWVDQLEEAIERDPNIGIIGCKRRDLIQTTWHPDPEFRSEMKMLPHEPGQKWITVEKTDDIIGSAIMLNSLLLDKIGFLRQIKKYGYDDNLASWRSRLAGFYNCFLQHIDIEHIDNTHTPYNDWKHKHSEECTDDYIRLVRAMVAGTAPIYYNPFEK